MRSDSKLFLIPGTVLAAGAVGAALRALLYTFGFDSRHLLNPTDPRHVLCWVVTAAVGLFLFLTLRKLDGSLAYKHNFPQSTLSAAGEWLAAAILLYSVLTTDQVVDHVDLIRYILSLACVPCIVFSGICRFRGAKPHYLFHTVICIFFALDMIWRYQAWSGNPRLADYCFALPASIFLALSAYSRLAFGVGYVRRQTHLFFTLAAVYLCLLSTVGTGSEVFYLGGAIWALSNLCPLRGKPVPQEKKEEI